MTKGLHIVGDRAPLPFRNRRKITVGGSVAYIEGRLFEYLLTLAHARLTSGDGWVYKEDIEPGYNQARYLYRLRRKLRAQGVELEIENNCRGYYRLTVKALQIQIEWGSLLAYPDNRIAKIAREAVGRPA